MLCFVTGWLALAAPDQPRADTPSARSDGAPARAATAGDRPAAAVQEIFGTADLAGTANSPSANPGHFHTGIGRLAAVVNLAGVQPGQLRLTPEVLARIYLGTIIRWKDAAITELNQGLDLPDEAITVVYRLDPSATSWLFTNFLSENSSDWADEVGNNTQVSWPAGVGAKGDAGVVATVSGTPGAIGFVERRYASRDGMSVVRIGNPIGFRATRRGWRENKPWSRRPGSTAQYAITDLGTLGGTESFAYGVNDFGQIVGYSRTSGDTDTHAFLYDNGEMRDLYPLTLSSPAIGVNNFGQIPGGSLADSRSYPARYDSASGVVTLLGSLGGSTSNGFTGVATAVNNLGQVVGYSYLDDVNRHAFLYTNGTLSDLGSLGGYSGANAINDKGIIVGFSSNKVDGNAHAFLYDRGRMKDIDPVNAGDFTSTESYAHDINNFNKVVGEFLTQDQAAFHAFLYRAGAFTDLGAAGSPQTTAYAINDGGVVVGITFVPYIDRCLGPQSLKYVPCTKYKQHAFVYANGKLTDLNDLVDAPGWELTWALDVNDRGQIAGYGTSGGSSRAFLLTPSRRH
jgi:probable HAF family extracellular repeat protein